MIRFFAFGLHIGDIGKRTHPKMAAWLPALNARLSHGVPVARIVAWFDKSGNFVVDAEHDDTLVIAERLREASERPFAVLPVAELRECISRLNALKPPDLERGFRWTLGASFRIGRCPVRTAPGEPWMTRNGYFFPLTQGMVGVWKRDRLVHSGCSERPMTLESRHRDPWGAVGRDIATTFGGTWTSRSARTISGLLRRETGAAP